MVQSSICLPRYRGAFAFPFLSLLQHIWKRWNRVGSKILSAGADPSARRGYNLGMGRAQQLHVWAQLGCSFWVELVPVEAAQVSVAVKELPVQCYSGKEPLLGQARLPCLRVPVPSMWSCRQTHISCAYCGRQKTRCPCMCPVCPRRLGDTDRGLVAPRDSLGSSPIRGSAGSGEAVGFPCLSWCLCSFMFAGMSRQSHHLNLFNDTMGHFF